MDKALTDLVLPVVNSIGWTFIICYAIRLVTTTLSNIIIANRM